MASGIRARATIEDLLRVDGKAELIGGRIVHLMPTGFRPGRVAFRIAVSLNDHAEATGRGIALPDNVGYTVPELASGRRSFAPDASYYVGLYPDDAIRFVEGPPTFAVEVRSEGDYGPAAEAELAAKRADYFDAGTLVVWDVDPVARLVTSHRADSPRSPSAFRDGEEADAEPAVPGWRPALGPIFRDEPGVEKTDGGRGPASVRAATAVGPLRHPAAIDPRPGQSRA